jgi:cardiolipin synthase C
MNSIVRTRLAQFLLIVAIALVTYRAQADDVRYLPTAQVALSQYAQTLQAAEKSIDLVYYIYDPCALSAGLIDKILIQKATQKTAPRVHVRILIDAEGYGDDHVQRDVFASAMKKYGIEIRYFNRFTSHWDILANNRLHAKLMLVDGKTYITGGRNIGDDYFSLGTGINFVDRDIMGDI